MLTKKDITMLITSMKEVFAMKEDLKALEQKITMFKDEILAEIQNLRVDVTIVTGYQDMIERHETDIEVIKKHLKLPAS